MKTRLIPYKLNPILRFAPALLIALIVGWHAGALAQASSRSEALDNHPDLIVQPGASYVVAAHSGNSVHEFEIPSSEPAERWIRGFDFHPGDSRVVQSAWIYVKKTGQWLGGWVPGQDKMIAFPEGVAAQLPAGSSIVMEVHYKALDVDVSDRSQIGLYFATSRPVRPLSGVGVESQVTVPVGDTPLQVKKEFTIISDSYAIALRPEMLTAGRALQVKVVEPSGQTFVLLNTPDYREDSQIPYILSQPRLLPKGSRIVATASYRNLTSAPIEDTFRLSVALYPSAERRITAESRVAPRAAVRPAIRPAVRRRAPVRKKAVPKKTVTPTTRKKAG